VPKKLSGRKGGCTANSVPPMRRGDAFGYHAVASAGCGGPDRDQADAASAEVGVSIGTSATIVVPVEVDFNSSLPPS
jgi:hypothetical protein